MSLLRPPVKVALALPVRALPRGRVGYEPKFDGHRLVVFRTEGRTLLQARSGRMVTEAFPDLVDAAQELPVGTVLDGEVVIWTGGRTDFAAVQKRAMANATRAVVLAQRLPASYAAFDLLAVGDADLRPLPYERRRNRLVELLAPLGPPVQPVPMTTDAEEATTWYETLPALGVEGLVVKQLDQPYRGGRRDWQKLRHTETRDAVLVGVTGSRTHPRALALVLPGDDTPVVSSPLAPDVRARIADALGRLPDPGAGSGARSGVGPSRTADGTVFRPVPGELTVEVRQSTTRHMEIIVVRLRVPD